MLHDYVIYYNYDAGLHSENTIVLALNGGSRSDVGMKPHVHISVKHKDMQAAEITANVVFETFYPKKQYQKPIAVNDMTMCVTADSQPYYEGKDKSGRHVYVFDLSIVHTR